MAFYERLTTEIPPGLVDLLRIPGLGPKTVRQLHADLGIASMDDLRAAAEGGRLRGLRGMSAKTEKLVLEGIARLDANPGRMLLDKAETRVTDIIAAIADTPGVRRLEPAGSFRRRKESIGDLDLLAETDDAATAHRAVHRPRRRRPRRQPGRLQGGGAAACAARRST